jgi:hypothetical protein
MFPSAFVVVVFVLANPERRRFLIPSRTFAPSCRKKVDRRWSEDVFKELVFTIGYLQLFPDRAKPGDSPTRRIPRSAASLRLTQGSSWILESRKTVSQRRSSPSKLSSAEDALKRRLT